MRNGGKHFCTPSTVVASSATVQSASPFARARERRLTTGRLGPRRRRAQGRVSGLCASSRSTPCIRRAKLAGDISNDVDVRGFADLSLKFSKRQNRPRSLQRLLSWRRGRRPRTPRKTKTMAFGCLFAKVDIRLGKWGEPDRCRGCAQVSFGAGRGTRLCLLGFRECNTR